MPPQQSSFYGQMAGHHQPAPTAPAARAPPSAGCLAKLQQLTNGLESSATPTSSAASSAHAASAPHASSNAGRGLSSKQSSRASAAAAEQAARNAAALLPSGYPGYPTSHQAASGPTPPPPSHTPGVPNAGSYYAAGAGHTAAAAPPIPPNHLMQPYGQNHHHMLNYTAGYGFMNQFMYHMPPAADQRNSAATPQPGPHGPPAPHPQHHMYPGYPHLGYPANYHR
jgi:hypothetical protein